MSALPPPLPITVVPRGLGLPPIINLSAHTAARNCPPPPPLPAEALQQQMLTGTLSGPVAELEQDRRKAKRHSAFALFWAAVFIFTLAAVLLWVGHVGTLGGSVEYRKNLIMPGIIVGAPLCLISLLVACRLYTLATRARFHYCQAYKSRVFSAAIRLLNPTFEYRPDPGISYERFRQSRMFLHRHSIDTYLSEDHVQGLQGATAFEFAEVRCGYHKNPLLTPKHEPTYQPVFHGLYFIADFNKHFATSTLVLPRNRELPRTRLFEIWGSKTDLLIHLEDPEFDRQFIVYADDELEVRYLLTPALMQRILALSRARPWPISLSFLNDQLHLALEDYRDLFEPDLHASAWSLTQIQLFLNQVRGVLSLIDTLNLNTRIWTKS